MLVFEFPVLTKIIIVVSDSVFTLVADDYIFFGHCHAIHVFVFGLISYKLKQVPFPICFNLLCEQ